MNYRTFLVLFVFFALFSTGCTPTDNESMLDAGELPTPDRCTNPEVRSFILSGYEARVDEANLSSAMQDWLKANKGIYSLAFIHARCRPDTEIKVLVAYYGGNDGRERFFVGGWTPEKEEGFRSLLERLLEAIYPGYNFTVVFNKPGEVILTEAEADIVVNVGFTGLASYASGKRVMLIHPTIIGHEIGHLCPNPEDGNGWCTYFPHHYPDANPSDHSEGPPEVDEGECIFYRTGPLLGKTELLMLGKEYPAEAKQQVLSLGVQIEAMLPEETNLRKHAPDLGLVPPLMATLLETIQL